LTAAIGNPIERGGIDGFISFLCWQRAGVIAEMTKKIAEMLALEMSTQ
jgi:hypothetical protein